MQQTYIKSNMNKKGISYEAIITIPDIIFLIIAFLTVGLLLGLHMKSTVEIFPLESDVTALRLIYNSLAYEDPDTGRLYPGIIDLNKLQYLEKAFSPPEKYMPLKITFEDKEAFADEESFKDNYAARFVTHRGRINLKKIRLYALTSDSKNGMLEILVTQKT